MKKFTTLLTIFLAGLLLVACTQEEKKQEPVVRTPQPATEPSQQMSDKTGQEVKDTTAAAGTETKQTTDTMQTAAADNTQKGMEPVIPVEKDVATVAPTKPVDDSAATPPVTVTYEATMGTVTFEHAEHAARLDCSQCHTTDPPQKIAIDKEVAHNQLCKVCHKKSGGNAPTACPDCHKK